MKSLYLYAHTVSRMDRRQIVGMAERKMRELLVPRLPINFDHRYEDRIPGRLSIRLGPFAENTTLLHECLGPETRSTYRESAREAAEGTPTFLNRSLRISDGDSVNWYDNRLGELPRLWRLKLYAFQPLTEAALGYESSDPNSVECRQRFDAWVRDWIETVEIGGRNYLRSAWTPYAVSLRIQYWIRYLSWRQTETPGRDHDETDPFEELLAHELFKNALFLRSHVEWDVGGNHLVENGAALVAAGLFFGDHGQEFLETGLSILVEAVDDQFLDDGCHFERSPMYHLLCLTRLLTVCDLLDRAGKPVPETIRLTGGEAAGFLAFITPPDRRIPLLNDSVYGQALPLEACIEYADRVGISKGSRYVNNETMGQEAVAETSGYRWLRTSDGAMLVDGGPVGPPHLPGHAHSDTLSVLLWLDGQPVLTDTGTFGYESDKRREYARGVRGHSTVQVNETEPIAIGGRFLMGPRPVPKTRFESGEVSIFEGRYEATPFDGMDYTHHRVAYAGDRWWAIQDTVQGDGPIDACSRLHVHPDIEPIAKSGGTVEFEAEDEPVGCVYPLGETRIETTQKKYFPRFGVERERPVLELTTTGPMNDMETPGFLVTPQGIDGGIEMNIDGSLPTAVTVAGDRYRLPEVQLSRY